MAKSIQIQIDPSSLNELKEAQYSLCIAGKVNDSYDVAWWASGQFLTENTFSWPSQYQIFGANVFEVGAQTEIATSITDIALGETSVLDQEGVVGPARTGGPSNSITLVNQYGPVHPGLMSLLVDPDGIELSAPVYVSQQAIASGTAELTPTDVVLVWFQQNISSGTMIDGNIPNPIEIDMTATDSVTWLYQNGGWSRQ
jgi:hypothetical protein